MNETTIIGVRRHDLTFASAAALAPMGTVTIAAHSEGAPNQGKAYVCTYVGKPGPERLLLVTCGGSWNAAAQNYEEIGIVLATPVSG